MGAMLTTARCLQLRTKRKLGRKWGHYEPGGGGAEWAEPQCLHRACLPPRPEGPAPVSLVRLPPSDQIARHTSLLFAYGRAIKPHDTLPSLLDDFSQDAPFIE